MNHQHMEILKLGVGTWNKWRESHPEIVPDLSGAMLTGLKAPGINFTRTNLSRAVFWGAQLAKSMFIGANLNKTIFIEARLNECFFSGTNLRHTSFNSAWLQGANFMRCVLTDVDLSHADLRGADLRLARLEQVNLEFAMLSGVNLANARMVNCLVHGMMAEEPESRGLQAQNLIISNHSDPTVTVDNFEVARTVFTRLIKMKIDDSTKTTEGSLVLVCGNFQGERRYILKAIRKQLELRNLIPVVMHFDKPEGRGFFDIIRQIAALTRYIIIDASLMEGVGVDFLERIAVFKLPVQLMVKAAWDEQSWLAPRLQKCPWILSPFSYQTPQEAAAAVREQLIEAIELKTKELQNQK